MTITWLHECDQRRPEPNGLHMVERQPNVRSGVPPLGDNRPVGTESEGKVAISRQQAAVEFPLLNEVEYDQHQERLVRRRAARHVPLQRREAAEPDAPVLIRRHGSR